MTIGGTGMIEVAIDCVIHDGFEIFDRAFVAGVYIGADLERRVMPRRVIDRRCFEIGVCQNMRFERPVEGMEIAVSIRNVDGITVHQAVEVKNKVTVSEEVSIGLVSEMELPVQ